MSKKPESTGEKSIKSRLLSNLGLKILALISAMFVWLAVSNVVDPSITKTISGIPVTVTDESVLTSENKVYSLAANTTASIKIKGRRSIVANLSEGDFSATAPLDEMSIVNAVPIYISVNKSRYRDMIEITEQTNSITVDIESIVKQEYDVQVDYKGEPAEGYARDTVTLDRSQISVTAPKSVQNLINKVAISVDVSNSVDDVTGKYTINLYQADGTEIDKNDSIKLSRTKVKATVNILKVAEVAVGASTIGSPADGYDNTEIEVSPQKIKIMGEADVVDNAANIEIPPSLINISQATSDVVKNINITSFIPEGCKLYNAEDSKVTVTVTIESQVSKSITISKADIHLINTPEGYNVEFDDDSAVKVNIEGIEEILNTVDKTSLNATLDLSEAKAGTNSIALNVTLPQGVSQSNGISIKVKLVSAGADEETTEK